MLLVARQTAPDAAFTVRATHDDAQEAIVLGLPDYSGARVYRRVGDALLGEPILQSDTWLNAPESLADYARARSKAIEAQGVTISGVHVATDRDSQGLISRAVDLLAANPDLTVIRFDPGGDAPSLTLDRTTMTAIGVAVGMRVQQTFARRCDALDGIRGGTVTTTAEIDAILEA